MSIPHGYEKVIPIHQLILDVLVEQIRLDACGSIGWGGPFERKGIKHTPADQAKIYQPLIERGLVRDCTEEMGSSGRFFVRLTELGQVCAQLGIMPDRPGMVSVAEVRKAIGGGS